MDLGFEFADLSTVNKLCDQDARRGGASAYCFRGLGLNDELVLLQIFEGDLHVGGWMRMVGERESGVGGDVEVKMEVLQARRGVVTW